MFVLCIDRFIVWKGRGIKSCWQELWIQIVIVSTRSFDELVSSDKWISTTICPVCCCSKKHSHYAIITYKNIAKLEYLGRNYCHWDYLLTVRTVNRGTALITLFCYFCVTQVLSLIVHLTQIWLPLTAWNMDLKLMKIFLECLIELTKPWYILVCHVIY